VNIVDWVLIGALLVFVVIGWNRGFVAGLLSFAGFLGGGLIALLILPPVIDATGLPPIAAGAVMGVGILALAFSGQFATGLLADRLSTAITWSPAKFVDHAAGAALNILVLAVLTWIVISIAAYLPSTSLTEQMSRSKVASALDALVPTEAQGVFDNLQSALSSTSVPALFGGLTGLSGPDVAEPDPNAETPSVRAAAASVVQVFGDATECKSDVSGSGFAVGPQEVITNAHVVAGVTDPKIRTEHGTDGLPATVVYFDPVADIAVLHVPGLSLVPLQFADEQASTGDSAVVAGFPRSGPFQINPVRVRTLVSGRRQDIYGNGGSTRNIYIVRGTVQRGNSGGPVLRPDGKVLGMVFGADEDQKTNGYALAASDLAPGLALAAGKTAAVDTGSCRIRD
jgi:S1-C subfamily serine protease